MRALTFALVLSAALAAAACGGANETPADASQGPRDGHFSAAQVDRLRGYVDAERVKYGRSVGCIALARVLPDFTSASVLQLTGVRGALAAPWASGTLGSVAGREETYVATLYDRRGVERHAGLREVEGEGWLCFVTE